MRPNRGLSLMEVMISIAILAASAILLSQLAGVGRDHSRKADVAAQAQELANNLLNELLAGIAVLEPTEDEPFFDRPEWTYTIEVTPLETLPQLSEVVVSVRKVPLPVSGKASSGLGPDATRPAYQIVRWMPSPFAESNEFEFGLSP